ncbi:exopolyphosphatase [Cytobacillus spongiae]|uniref:exopolyphosphatase n=1 Tax=Cytobacillus spongiae TaxID=2901381 RepID=UPI001F343B59|nr:exopolyphosphatase [Cytobacillus spongiae]UII57214.1 exopolyphosphatase [Cytobacillus spongiae]
MLEKTPPKWAIIDIGSNTIRLVIYEKVFGTYKEAENIKAVARLREYLNEGEILEEEGIQVLLKVLAGFKDIIKFHQINSVKCVATATIRQSRNQKSILEKVNTETGFNIQILSEQEEAYYGYYAIIHTTPIEEGVTIDIGGGSTEITYFKDRKIVHSHSFPFGVVSLKERFFQGSDTELENHAKLNEFIKASLNQLPWLKDVGAPIVAIGGSARNIAQVHQNLINYQVAGIHQYQMTNQQLKETKEFLFGLNIEELQKLEGLSKDRSDIILPAVEVFVQLCDFAASQLFMVSRKGLRDGLFLNEIDQDQLLPTTKQIIDKSINELMLAYGIDCSHSKYVEQLSTMLFNELQLFCNHNHSKELLEDIKRSSYVYYLGEYVDSDASSQHTFYLLANTSINGLVHKKRVRLALMASFKNKNFLKYYLSSLPDWFSKEEVYEIRIAGALIKFASALDASKREIVKNIRMVVHPNGEELTFHIECTGNFFVEQYEGEKHVRQLEKALKRSIHLKFYTNK